MRTRVLQEKNYAERMQNGVEPYLAAHAEEFYWERESGHPIHVLRYRAFRPRGVVVISHGFTENAEKYKEIVYYFIKEHFHVYLPEHCGHGKSYRLVEDPSLVYVDSYHRYVEDLLFVARKAKAEACGLPLVLYSHSMGGGIAAAAAAKAPHLFRKVVLSSPMIRPLTGKVPFADAKRIAAFACATERGTQYVVGQKPYQGIESFKQSSSLSRPRFLYYQQKREKEARKNQKVVSIKEIRMFSAIDTHDFETKVNQAKKFLQKGAKVKVSLRFRGREMAHKDVGREILNAFFEELKDVASVDKPAKMEGRSMVMFLSATK